MPAFSIATASTVSPRYSAWSRPIGVTTAQVFTRSTPEKASPDLQLLFTPASYDLGKFGELEREEGMTVAICPVRPDSRGTVMARTADPMATASRTPSVP